MRNAVTDSKLYHGEKYHIIESMINSFTWQMNITVRSLQKSDFGQYVCSSENALGKSDAPIRLQGKEQNNRKINFFSFLFSFTSNSLIYGITIVSTLFYFNATFYFLLLLLLTPAALIHDA